MGKRGQWGNGEKQNNVIIEIFYASRHYKAPPPAPWREEGGQNGAKEG